MRLTALESEKRRLNKLCHFWLSQQDLKENFNGFDKASAEFRKALAEYDKIYQKIERLKLSIQ